LDNVVSAKKVGISIEQIKAVFCEDDDWDKRPFSQCRYKIKVDFSCASVSTGDIGGLVRNDSKEFERVINKLVAINDRKSYITLMGKFVLHPPKFISFITKFHTGVRDNVRLLEILPSKDSKNYRIACIAIKVWARSMLISFINLCNNYNIYIYLILDNHIYRSSFGLYKGVHLNILMAKVVLLYPNSTVSFLLEQFFSIFLNW
jgi:hypothetical protein